jgi:hypothetical protein
MMINNGQTIKDQMIKLLFGVRLVGPIQYKTEMICL